jgi:hypothetical protein
MFKIIFYYAGELLREILWHGLKEEDLCLIQRVTEVK